MLNKIIIDGIDVSECKYFQTINREDYDVEIDNCCCESYVPCSSEYKHNCDYKQLKRKEQECEELKKNNAEIQESEIELENMKNSLFIDYMKYKQVLDTIEKLISEALDPKKTETEQSFDNFYKCLDIIKEAKEK